MSPRWGSLYVYQVLCVLLLIYRPSGPCRLNERGITLKCNKHRHPENLIILKILIQTKEIDMPAWISRKDAKNAKTRKEESDYKVETLTRRPLGLKIAFLLPLLSWRLNLIPYLEKLNSSL